MATRRITTLEVPAPREELALVLAELEPEAETRRPAWRILLIVVIALVTAALLDSRALLDSARGRSLGPGRDAMLAVAQPVDDAAHRLHLDAPRRLADEALGRPAPDTGPGLAEAAPPAGAPTLPVIPVIPVIPVTPGAPSEPAIAAPPPAPVAPPAHRPIEKVHPLKLWITGDSDVDYLGQALLEQSAEAGTVRAGKGVDVHIGTGLVRPDVFDWLSYARSEAPKRDVDAVLLTLGGNDAQGIPDGPGKAVQPGDPRWQAAYAQRVVLVAQELSLHGTRPVYWVSLPPARDKAVNHAFFEINGALRYAATQVPGMVVIDALPALSDHGRYSAYLPGSGGRKVLVRQGDGIHATFDGSRRLATTVLERLRADWGL